MRWLERLAMLLVVVGALNWGLVGLFKFDLVAEVVGEEFGQTNTISRVIYVLVGLAGIVLLASQIQHTETSAEREPQRVRGA